MKNFNVVAVLIGLVISFSLSSWAYEGQALLDYARQERTSRAQFADQQGAKSRLTDDGKTFLLEWVPPAFHTNSPDYMVITVGGHSSYAFDDFFVWYHFLKDRKLGFLALQWWYGENQQRSGYMTPEEMYEVISIEMQRLNIKPGHVLLHGFSRGSANTYALAALDRKSGKNYFGMIIANAGSMVPDYLPNKQIDEGSYGDLPFKGTRWITYAGAKDLRPEQSGYPGMRETAKWIQKNGGKIMLAIEDPEGGHGGFHRRPQNVEQALDLFTQNSGDTILN